MMNKFAQFNVNERYQYVLECKQKAKSHDIAADIHEYVVRAQRDIDHLFKYALPFFFPLQHEVRQDLKVSIDPYDYSFFAKVTKKKSCYEIVISIGTILAIDEAQCLLTSWFFPNAKLAINNYENNKVVDIRYLDYSFLFDDELLNTYEKHQFISIYPISFMDVEPEEYRIIASNLSILWVILHEIGHVQLEHFSFLSKEAVKNEITELFGITEWDIDNKNSLSEDFSRKMLCFEFSADLYANFVFFSTFYRKDAIKYILPRFIKDETIALSFVMKCASLPVILLQRAYKSAAPDGLNTLENYPSLNVRLFNCMSSAITSIYNTKSILGSLQAASVHIDTTINVDFSSFASVYSVLIGIFDRLMRELHVIPSLLPWDIQCEILLLKDGITTGADYEIKEKSKFEQEWRTIIASLLSSQYAVANCSNESNLKQYHNEWRTIIFTAHEYWLDKINECKKMTVVDLIDTDFNVPSVYKYYGGIVQLYAEVENGVYTRDLAFTEAKRIAEKIPVPFALLGVKE
ncbi:hypothetical protein QUF50_06085 [Thiotrichales bacterium HSG1]|nr:hypothetical protein [Thiotrichales bacterium HSG1]